MGPLIDSELERVDRKHAQLTQVSSGLVEALNLYHMLMREPSHTPKPYVPYTPPPQQVTPLLCLDTVIKNKIVLYGRKIN